MEIPEQRPTRQRPEGSTREERQARRRAKREAERVERTSRLLLTAIAVVLILVGMVVFGVSLAIARQALPIAVLLIVGGLAVFARR